MTLDVFSVTRWVLLHVTWLSSQFLFFFLLFLSLSLSLHLRNEITSLLYSASLRPGSSIQSRRVRSLPPSLALRVGGYVYVRGQQRICTVRLMTLRRNRHRPLEWKVHSRGAERDWPTKWSSSCLTPLPRLSSIRSVIPDVTREVSPRHLAPKSRNPSANHRSFSARNNRQRTSLALYVQSLPPVIIILWQPGVY